MPIRIAAVSYLNTKPFIYGLLRSPIASEIELNLHIPSECARMLKSGEVDLALTPVAIIPELPEAHIVSDFCIGAFGKVKTVCIYSEIPIDEVQAIWLDYHSRTSVALAQLICKEYLKISPEFWSATAGFEDKIGGSVAGLIIGDRAIAQAERYPFVYDLAELWLEMTGLPFVFAAWVSTKPLDPDFVAKLNDALGTGVQLVPDLIKVMPDMPGFDLQDYYKTCISYELDAPKRQALEMFLEYLSGKQPVQIGNSEPIKTVIDEQI